MAKQCKFRAQLEMQLNIIEELREIINQKWTQEQQIAYITFLNDFTNYIHEILTQVHAFFLDTPQTIDLPPVTSQFLLVHADEGVLGLAGDRLHLLRRPARLLRIVEAFQSTQRSKLAKSGIFTTLRLQKTFLRRSRRDLIDDGVLLADPVVLTETGLPRVDGAVESGDFRVDVLLPVVGLDGAG
ncbi:hypothetical protein DAPPUDRAFT_274281, partial [Daphnia pulex]